MKRKLILFVLITFLTFGLAGCDLLSMLFGMATTTVTTTIESTDTTESTETTATIETTTDSGTTTTAPTTTADTSVTTTAVQFTITFVDHDGTVLKTQVVTSGGSATPPADPVRIATAQYTYAFAGWSGTYTGVTSNAMVLATYTQTLRQYTVTFYGDDGTTMIGAPQTVAYGSAATAPASPDKPDTAQWDYAFTGWDTAFDNVQANLSVKAVFSQTLRQYTVIFYDDDGVTAIGTPQTVAYGSAATAPASPVKPDTAQWDFTFNGWDTAFTNVQSNLTVKATYVAVLRQYTVTFYDDDGSTQLHTATVAYGSDATAPANPTKPSTAQFDYAFAGWDVPFTNITGPLAVRATYTATEREYTVTFLDVDGTLLGSEVVLYGDGATPPADPVRPSTPQFHYAFAGWDVSYDPISGDTTVNATYTATLRQYTVTFYDDDGFTVLGADTVDWGTAATAPADPTKPATPEATYVFSHWEGDFSAVHGTLSVIAAYTETRIAFHVAFVNHDGTLLDHQLVTAGGDAVAPADPVRPDTAQYTFTFAGWDGTYVGVDSDRVIVAVYTAVVNVYTVEFYDEDGLILLGTSTVEYGQPAVPPENPVKTDWYFVGWSQGVAFITRDMVVHAVFTDVLWDRQVLLDYLAGWHDETPTPEQLEADVVFLLGLLNADSEYEAYQLTQVFEGLVENVMAAETLVQLQEAYTNAKASGFDRDRVIGILMTVIDRTIAEDLAHGRYADILNQIAMIEQLILDTEAMIPSAIQQGYDYCVNTLDEPWKTTCQLSWQTFVTETDLYHAFAAIRDNIWAVYGDAWDWDVFYNIIWNLEEVYYYTYVEPDAYRAELYTDAYNEYLLLLTPDEIAMYDTVVLPWSAWTLFKMTSGDPARNILGSLWDLEGNYVLDRLMDLMAEYDQLFWSINGYRWHLVELGWQLEDALREQQFLLAIQAWFASPEGAAEAELLAGTVYDMLESVLYGADESTFDLIYGLATGTIDPATDPASLLGYVDRSATLIRLFMSTVGTDDIDNLKAVVKDLLSIYIAIQGFDEETTASMILCMEGIVDDYALMAADLYGEMLTLLDSLDETKIQIILDQLAFLMDGGMIVTARAEEGMDVRQIIAIAKIVDTLAYESGIDVDTLTGYFVRIYYDTNYHFVYDEVEMLAVTAALVDSIHRILQLVHIVASWDVTAFPSAAQIELLMELKIRIETIGEAFGWGCPTMLLVADYTVYEHWMFVELIYRLEGWDTPDAEAEAMIAMFVATFELSEQDTYFLMLSFMNAFMMIGRNPSLSAISDFYFGLAAMGYTNEAIAHYMTNFAVNMIDFKLLYSDAGDDIDDYLMWIAEYESYILALTGDYDAGLAAIYAEIELQPDPDLRAAAYQLVAARAMSDDLWRLYNQIYDGNRYSDAYYGAWDEWIYGMLTTYRNDIAYYSAPNHALEGDLGGVMALYDGLWTSLTPEQQSMYAGPINAYGNHVDFFWITYQDIEEDMWASYGGVWTSDGYMPLIDFIQGRMTELGWIEDEILWKQQQIASWYDEIAYLEEHGEDELLMFQGFLADPANRALVEASLLIVLDEAANLLAVADIPTIDLIIGIASGYRCPCELDLTAAGILGYTQSLSTMLKSLGSTMTEEEINTLVDLAMNIITLLSMNNNDWTEAERLEFLARIELFIGKYLVAADITRDDITDFLDSLTVEKIQVVLEQLAVLGISFDYREVDPIAIFGGEIEEGPSEIEFAIAIAKIVDALLYDGSLDTDSLITTMIEIYYDFVIGGPYDYLVKADVVSAFQRHVDELILLAHEVAALDPSMITPDAIALLTEVRQRIEFLMGILQSGNLQGILEPISFGYERWMFVDLLWNLDWQSNWDDEAVANAAITTVTQVFESTEEEAYYNLMAIMNLVRDKLNSPDPEDVLEALAMLESIGFTDADIAQYLGNLPLAVLTYQQFIGEYYYDGNPYEWDLQWALADLAYWQGVLENDLLYAQQEVDYWQDQLDMILNVGNESIPFIMDAGARDATLAYWNLRIDNNQKGLLYYWTLEEAEAYPEWNYGLFYDLQYDLDNSILFTSYYYDVNGWSDPITAMNYRIAYDAAFALLTPDEQALYGPILALYEIFYTQNVNDLAEAEDVFNDAFWSASVDDQMLMNSIAIALSNYWYTLDSLHGAQQWLLDVVDYYATDILAAQNHLAEVQALYDSYEPANFDWLITFFADPANDALWNTITVAVVEEIGNLAVNITPEMVDLVLSFIKYQDLQNRIGLLQDYIEEMDWTLNDFMFQASEAIALLDDPVSAQYAQTWWDVNLASAALWVEYNIQIESSWSNPFFNPDVYFNLESLLDSALYEEIVNMNPAGGVWYREEISLQLSWLTPDEATYMMSLLAAYEACQSHEYQFVLPAAYDYYGHQSTGEDYTSELNWALESLYFTQMYKDEVLMSGNYELMMIVDPVALERTQAHWNWSITIAEAYLAYYAALTEASENPLWWSDTFYSLVDPLQSSIYYDSYLSDSIGYTDVELAGYYHDLYMANLSMLSPEELDLYDDVLSLFAYFFSMDQNEQAEAQDLFWWYYYAGATAEDQMHMTNVDYLGSSVYEPAIFDVYWTLQDVEYWQALVDAAGEDAWEYYYVDSLVWCYRDALEELRSAEIQLDHVQSDMVGLLDLTPAGLAGYAQTVSAYLGIVFDTIDETEAQALADFLYSFTAAHVAASGLYTEEEQIALMAEIDGVFEYYVDSVLYAPEMLSTFLANLTEEEIAVILNSIAVINALDGIDPDLDNMVRAVAIADLILAVAGDGNLDVAFLIDMVVYGYFDGTYHFHYEGEIVIVDRATLIASLVGQILVQADVIDGYDPYLLTEEERGEINEFHLLVEELMPYLEYGPEYDPIA